MTSDLSCALTFHLHQALVTLSLFDVVLSSLPIPLLDPFCFFIFLPSHSLATHAVRRAATS